MYGLAIAVPNLFGVPLGVALTSAGQFGWVAVAAASPLLALPLLPLIARSIRPAEPTVGAGSGPAVSPLVTLRAIAGTVLVLLVVTLSGGGVLTFLPVARPSGALATAALLAFGVTGAAGRWRAGVLADRLGASLLLPLSVLLAAGGLAVLAAGLALGTGTAAPVMVLAGAAVLGLGYGSVQNITLVVAFERAGPANETTASAAWNAAYDAGTAIGALLVGVVAAAGPGLPWTFAGCALLIAMTLALAVGATRPAG